MMAYLHHLLRSHVMCVNYQERPLGIAKSAWDQGSQAMGTRSAVFLRAEAVPFLWGLPCFWNQGFLILESRIIRRRKDNYY